MQLSLDVIDSLRATALNIAGVLSLATITPNKFWDAGGNILPRYEIQDDSIICYTGSGKIVFTEIRPHKIDSLHISEPVEFNTQRESYVLDTYRNAGSTPIDEEESYTEEHSHTIKTDVMAELSTSLRTKIGGSYAGFSAELEASLSAKLGVNHSEEEVNKHGDTKKFSFTIPPWTSVSISQEHDITDISETITLKCQLDAGVRLYGGFFKYFNSLYELTTYMRGGGDSGTGDKSEELDKFVATRKFEHFDLDKTYFAQQDPRRLITIEQERISRNVKTGKIERTETHIEP